MYIVDGIRDNRSIIGNGGLGYKPYTMTSGKGIIYDSELDDEYYHIFYKNKEIKELMQKTIPKIKEAIKNNITSSKVNKKVYIVSMKYKPDDNNKKLIVNVSQANITPDLNLSTSPNDDSFSIYYTDEDINNIGFDKSHILNIIDSMKKNKIDLTKQFVNISNIMSTIKKEKPIPKTPKLTNYILTNPIITKAQQKKIKSFNDDLLSIKNNIKTQHDKEEIKHLKAYFKTIQSKKNEYLKSIDNDNQPKQQPKPKPIKDTPQQKRYKEILANPKISEESKDAFKRFNHNGEKIMAIEDLNGWEANELWTIESSDDEEPPPKKTLTTQLAPKPKVAKPKVAKPKNIMKGRSDLIGNKITTELNVKKGLQPKVKRALKKSVIAELDNKMSGKGLRGRTISLSSSDSD